MTSGYTRLPLDKQTGLQVAVRRLAVTFVTFVGALGLLASSALLGLGDAEISLAVALFGLGGFAVFYILHLRLPPQRRSHERLIFAQVVFHIALISLVYTLVEASRGLALQLLCLVVIFDARRLPLRQTLIAAALSVLLPPLGMGLRWALSGPDPDWQLQLVFLVLGSVAMPALLLASQQGRALRRRKQAQRDEQAATLERLRQLSLHDSLTGVYNRQHIHSLLTVQLQRLKRGDGPSCLALLDLDHFKQVNDSHGHAAGDAVLRAFARSVQDNLRGTPHALGRWGGEEFLLLLPDSDTREATAALLNLQRALRLRDWSDCAPGLAVTVSAGALQLQPGLSAAQAVAAADRALYRAKAEGRDRSLWAAPEDHPAQATRPERDAARPQPPAVAAAAAAQGTGRGRTTRSYGRWSTLLLGRDPAMRRALRLCLVVSGIYLTLILATLGELLPRSFWAHDSRQVFMALEMLGAVVPYLLVRSGLTRHCGDLPLVVPQMMWASVLLVAAFVLMPAARAYCLQLLCVTLVFGFVDLNRRQTVFAGAWVIAMLLLGHLALSVLLPSGRELLLLGLQLIGSVTVLSLLSWLSHDYALMRAQLDAEAAQLEAAGLSVTAALRVDPMTGLHNRQHLQTLLNQACERHARSGRSFCVALIDLDHFKAINDRHGHAAGDAVLLHFAQTALQLGRATDMLGRWGGEEFLLLSEAENTDSSLRHLDRLRQALAQKAPDAGLPALRISFSAGLACHGPGEPPDQLLERADRALYAAKAQGRGVCVVAEEAGFMPPTRRPGSGSHTDTRPGGLA